MYLEHVLHVVSLGGGGEGKKGVITGKAMAEKGRNHRREKIDPHFRRADGCKRNAHSALCRNLSLVANRYSFARKGNSRLELNLAMKVIFLRPYHQ